jgi:hypothetical protein
MRRDDRLSTSSLDDHDDMLSLSDKFRLTAQQTLPILQAEMGGMEAVPREAQGEEEGQQAHTNGS